MNQPLGLAIGNALEVAEAAEVLHGNGPEDVREESLMLATELLYLAGRGHRDECRRVTEEALRSGKALEKFCAMVRTQGGDDFVIRDPSKFARAPVVHEVIAPREGYIVGMAAEYIGGVSVMLGAGRDDLGDAVDPLAGILLKKKYGDRVAQGEVIATLLTSEEDAVAEAEKRFLAAVTIGDKPPAPRPLIYARVGKDGIERF
jgi:pyrimidine-nucleoside phosphorylase